MVVRLCYGYIRVSTFKQAGKGLSLEDQKSRIEKYCLDRKHVLMGVTAEPAISGSEKMRDKRVKLTTLLKDLPAGSVLIVTDISRLSRSLRDFLNITKQLEEKKCQLIAITQELDTGSSYGRFNAGLLALLGQLELEITSDRNANIRKFKQEAGEFIGSIPYGWRKSEEKDGKPVEIQEEQNTIKLIFELSKQIDPSKGKIYTHYGIAKKLTELRIYPPGKSRKWYASAITNIIERKTGPPKPSTPEHPYDFTNYVPICERQLAIMPEDRPDELMYDSIDAFLESFNKSVNDIECLSDDDQSDPSRRM